MTQSEIEMFIFSTQHEFNWLMQKLGYPEHSQEAFNLTANLAAYTREMQSLWDGDA